MSATLFYILSLSTVLATLMAITRRELVHAIAYLVLSFFSIALIFYMMGAPLIAALEVIVYAGAIMVLFLFIVMMLEMGVPKAAPKPFLRTWGPAGFIALTILVCTCVLFASGPGMPADGVKFISPRTFGHTLFSGYALAVEAVSLLLLFALVGALYLGRRE